MLRKLIGTVAAAAFTLTGALSPAVAGGAFGYGVHSGGYSSHVSTNFRYSHGFGDDHRYRGGHGYRGGYGYRHHGGHHLGYLVPLAFLGGYLIANSQYAPRQRVVYAPPPPPPQAPRQNVWTSPAPSPSPSSRNQYCREYTTDVVIDGQTRHGYGQACRQEDGSWQIVSRNLAPEN